MKICFIQKQIFPYFGIIALSGYLKKFNIETDVLISNIEKNIIAKIKKINPDIVGISLLTTEHSWLNEISKQIKKELPDMPIVVGGIHAILYPKEILEIETVDFVCSCEGEKPLLSLITSLKKDKHPLNLNIKGIGYRFGSEIIMNENENLLNDTDISSFFDDREIYYRRYFEMKNDEQKQFYAFRGCPYKCSFCFNEKLIEIFDNKGKYIRAKKPEHLIEEILMVKKNSKIDSIFFADDLFTMNKNWLRSFLLMYKSEVGIPFMCTTRANLMNEEIAYLLSQSGCHTVSFGVETGNEKLRREILNKKLKDDDLLKCAKILKKFNIRVQTSNMFCLPGETLEDAFKTIDLNIRMKADFVFSAIFMPFPKTKLADYCIKNGFLDKSFNFSDLPQSFLTHSILNLKDKIKIENVQKSSYLLIKLSFLLKLFKWLIINFNFKRLFYLLLLISTFFRYKEERKISFFNSLTYLWRFRKSY